MTELTMRMLKAEFLRCTSEDSWARQGDVRIGADGVVFLCPKCFADKTNGIGTHSVICWSPTVPLEIAPGPGRWVMMGTGLDDISLVAGSSSIQLRGGCNAHFFVRDGKITTA